MSRRFSIRNKLLLAFLVMLLFSESIIGFSYLGYKKVYERIMPANIMSKKIEILMKDMEIIERDFYIYGKYDNGLYDENSEYKNEFDEKYSEILLKLNDLKKMVDELSDDFHTESIDNMITSVQEYEDTFEKIVTAVKNIGIEKHGYIGQMREKIHAVETSLKGVENDKFEVALLEIRRQEKDFLLRKNEKYREKFNSSVDNFKNIIEQSEELEDGKRYEILRTIEDYKKIFNVVVNQNVVLGLTDDQGLMAQNSECVIKMRKEQSLLNNEMSDFIIKTEKNMFMALGTIGVVNFFFAILYALFLSGIISKPIRKLNTLLKDIAEGEGDLTKELHVKSRDELNEMSSGFNKFVYKIKTVIMKVKEQSENLNSSVTEINIAIENSNNNIQDIAARMDVVTDAVQSNSSLAEEISASIEEVSNGASVVSGQAVEIDQNSQNMMASVNEGVDKLGEVQDSINTVKASSQEIFVIMREFNELSAQIQNITKMITDISDQTNLLALNAAIEAARAGDAGRGFAVVAEEIRQLAEQSKESANSITNIVNEINVKSEDAYDKIKDEQSIVDVCVLKAEETNSEFGNIIKLIRDVVENINNISSLSQNQSAIIEEIATGINDFSQVTQNTAESADQINERIEEQAGTFEEIGAQSEMLKALSDKLDAEVGKFKVE